MKEDLLQRIEDESFECKYKLEEDDNFSDYDGCYSNLINIINDELS